ncbi:uncharacterized protein LOC144035193 isoform X2 [Vanacampus margaritifer]
MNGSLYYWYDCDPYDAESGEPSAGLVVLFATHVWEFVFSLPSNLWLAWFILHRRSKVDGILTGDFFPFCLVLVKLPFYVMVPAILANHFLWRDSWLMAVTAIVSSSMTIVKPMLMCVVCVEKYLAVVRPLAFLRFKALKYKWRALVIMLCLGTCISASAVFQQSIVAICLIFPPVLAVDTYCCVAVLKALRKSPPGEREEVGKEKSHAVGNTELHGIKRKAFITILVIQVTHVVNYVPLIVTIPMYGRVPARVLKCQYMPLGFAAVISCGYLHPLFYLCNDLQYHKKTKTKI